MLKPLFAATILSLGFLAACSSSDDGDADPRTPHSDNPKEPNDGPAAPAQACTTAHKKFDRAPTDYYAQFTDVAEALAVAPKFTSEKFLPAGNDLEKRGTPITAKVFEGFKKLYPEALEGMDKPPLVLIVDTDEFNAAAYGLSLTRKSDGKRVTPWVFKFNRGFFNGKVTDAQIELVVAHELGHLFLRNGDDTIFKPVFFREKTTSDPIFGEYITSDATVEKETQIVIAAGERVGQLFDTELNGYGANVGATEFRETIPIFPRYTRYIDYLHARFAGTSATPTACTTAQQKVAQIDALIAKHYIAVDARTDFGADAATVDQLTKEYQGQESLCLKHVTGTFRDVVVAYKKAEDPSSAAEIDAIKDSAALNAYLKLSQNEIDADITDPSGNIVTKIMTLGIRAQDTIRAFIEDPRVEYSQVRVWDHEDEADEAAVRYAKLQGLPAADLIGALFSNKDPAQVQACKDQIAKGEIPSYGGTIDPHHSNCWRHYRNLKLETALKTCPSSWPQ